MAKTAIKSKRAKIRSAQRTVEYMMVTPEMAGDWLAKNPHNRKLRDLRVRRYAEDMKAGAWKSNAETIKFSPDGTLIDGQHRLAAIIFADVTVEMLVAKNVDPGVFDTVDTGGTRVIGDALYISHEGNAAQLGTALGYLWRYRNGGAFVRIPGLTTPKIQQLEELLATEPNIRQYIHLGNQLSRKLNIGQGLASVLYYLTAQVDEDYATLFWEGLLSGADLKESDPIWRLRERLVAKKSKPNANEIAGLAFKAWNLSRENKKIQILTWRPSKEVMPTPV